MITQKQWQQQWTNSTNPNQSTTRKTTTLHVVSIKTHCCFLSLERNDVAFTVRQSCFQRWSVWTFVKSGDSSEHSGRHSDDWSVSLWGSISKILSAGRRKSWNRFFFLNKKNPTVSVKIFSDIITTKFGSRDTLPFGPHSHIFKRKKKKADMGSYKEHLLKTCAFINLLIIFGVQLDNSAPSYTLSDSLKVQFIGFRGIHWQQGNIIIIFIFYSCFHWWLMTWK